MDRPVVDDLAVLVAPRRVDDAADRHLRRVAGDHPVDQPERVGPRHDVLVERGDVDQRGRLADRVVLDVVGVGIDARGEIARPLAPLHLAVEGRGARMERRPDAHVLVGLLLDEAPVCRKGPGYTRGPPEACLDLVARRHDPDERSPFPRRLADRGLGRADLRPGRDAPGSGLHLRRGGLDRRVATGPRRRPGDPGEHRGLDTAHARRFGRRRRDRDRRGRARLRGDRRADLPLCPLRHVRPPRPAVRRGARARGVRVRRGPRRSRHARRRGAGPIPPA